MYGVDATWSLGSRPRRDSVVRVRDWLRSIIEPRINRDRRLAIERMTRIANSNDRDKLAEVEAHLTDPDPEIRCAAVLCSAALGSNRGWNAATAELHRADEPAMQVTLVSAIGCARDSVQVNDAAAILLDLFGRSSSLEVKRASLESLGRLLIAGDNDLVVGQLVRVAESKDESIILRVAAIEGLVRARIDEGLKIATALLNQSSAPALLRYTALDSLITLGPAGELSSHTVDALTRDPDSRIRERIRHYQLILERK